MKSYTKNKLVMYKMVRDTIIANGTSWEGVPAFVNTVENYNAKVHLLEEKENHQLAITVGVSAVKDQLKIEKVHKIIRISGALVALGTAMKDEKLRREMNFTVPKLLKASRVDFLSKVDRIIDRASENSDALVDFGISAQDLIDLATIRTEMDASLSSPRIAIVNRKKTNIEIRELEREIDILLKDGLDKLMLVIKDSDPDFFSSYSGVRTVIPYGQRGGTSTNP